MYLITKIDNVLISNILYINYKEQKGKRQTIYHLLYLQQQCQIFPLSGLFRLTDFAYL